MRILIMSDSHGRTNPCDRAIEAFKPDAIIHLGDIERDVQYIEDVYPDIPLTAVRGNNDAYCARDTERVLEINNLKIFITHGHLYSVHDGGRRLALRAKELGCTLALFGHTHCPTDTVFDGVRVFNPGSISLPRGGNPSVGVLEVNENGKYGIVLCDWL